MTAALAIDTTSDYLSLALRSREGAEAAHYSRPGREMTRLLWERLDDLFARVGTQPAELELLIAARGPGSFTGTRIGLAVAKTFAQVLALPIVGVDTLRLLAAMSVPRAGATIHAALNCVRGELYHAAFRWEQRSPEQLGSDHGGLEPLTPIILTTLAELPGLVGDEPVVLRRFEPIQPGHEELLEGLTMAELRHERPGGALLLGVGMALFRQQPAGGTDPAEPIYLKSEAFRKWKP